MKVRGSHRKESGTVAELSTTIATLGCDCRELKMSESLDAICGPVESELGRVPLSSKLQKEKSKRSGGDDVSEAWRAGVPRERPAP